MSETVFETMRKAMVVSQLRPSDVSDPRIVTAMGQVEREKFVPEANRLVAYADRGVEIAPRRRLNPPLTTGLMLVHAAPAKDDKVLIVGVGTGYLAALIADMVDSVVALEADAELAKQARGNLAGYDNVRVEQGELTQGFADAAPYTLVLIDGAIEQLPDTLIEQMADDGRLLTPMDDAGVIRLAQGRKADGIVTLRPFADGGAQLLPEFSRPKAFQF